MVINSVADGTCGDSFERTRSFGRDFSFYMRKKPSAPFEKQAEFYPQISENNYREILRIVFKVVAIKVDGAVVLLQSPDIVSLSSSLEKRHGPHLAGIDPWI